MKPRPTLCGLKHCHQTTQAQINTMYGRRGERENDKVQSHKNNPDEKVKMMTQCPKDEDFFPKKHL